MKLHIFNPEHDLALAANQSNYTAPHAGRQLRNDLSFIPALWADEGDLVLVDDVDNARDKLRHLGAQYNNKVMFVDKPQLAKIFQKTMMVDSVHPWGWDKALITQLQQIGCPEIILPTLDSMERIRSMSSRQWAAENLQTDVEYVCDVDSLRAAVARRGKAVVKAPWSSSGRGVRYVSVDNAPAADKALVGGTDLEAILKWATNVIKNQGGVTVEPYYNKVRDFGMEFDVKDCKVEYRGLSVFETIKGAYTGNILAPEEEKEAMIAAYVSHEELERIRQEMIGKIEPVIRNIYSGPFGIDMMVCADEEGKTFINPCIELNLRRTMGHVALALGVCEKADRHLMRVSYDGNRYHLKVLPGKPSEDAPIH